LGVGSSHASSQSVVTETVVAFLKNVPPFQFLSTAELARLAGYVPWSSFLSNLGELLKTAGV
jgi:hypothetical protein